MSREIKTIFTVLSIAALLSVSAATGSYALPLKGVSSSVNPIGGFPVWVQDQNSLSLQACLEPANCILPVAGEEAQYNPALPLSFPTPLNFPAEHFYFFAESSLPITINSSTALVRMVIEAAYLPSIAPGNQNFFHRFRVRLSDPPEAGVYTLRHPWGSTTFTGQDCALGGVCTMTADVNVGQPPAFLGVLEESVDGAISTFLTQTNPVPAAGYIGSPLVAGPVTGGSVRNFIEIVAPSNAVIGTSAEFTIAGKKIGMDVIPSPAAPHTTTLVGSPVHTPVIITNITGAPLGFTGAEAIVISGTNAADFTIVSATNGCSGATLPVPAVGPPVVPGTCSFEVQFNPLGSTVAARTATLTITPDNTTIAPPVSVALTGTAQYSLTPVVSTTTTATGNRTPGTIAPSVLQAVNAGATTTFTLTPETGHFPRVIMDGALQTLSNNSFTVTNLSAHRTFDVKFIRNGDLVEDGSINVTDALRVLQVALGVGVNATSDERVAGDIGPLVSSLPKADGSVDVSDVMLILRRSLGFDPLW